MTQSGIEPATFRLVAQCTCYVWVLEIKTLNHCKIQRADTLLNLIYLITVVCVICIIIRNRYVNKCYNMCICWLNVWKAFSFLPPAPDFIMNFINSEDKYQMAGGSI